MLNGHVSQNPIIYIASGGTNVSKLTFSISSKDVKKAYFFYTTNGSEDMEASNKTKNIDFTTEIVAEAEIETEIEETFDNSQDITKEFSKECGVKTFDDTLINMYGILLLICGLIVAIEKNSR